MNALAHPTTPTYRVGQVVEIIHDHSILSGQKVCLALRLPNGWFRAHLYNNKHRQGDIDPSRIHQLIEDAPAVVTPTAPLVAPVATPRIKIVGRNDIKFGEGVALLEGNDSITQGEIIHRAIQDNKWTQAQAGQYFNLAQSRISQIVALGTAPDEWKACVRDGRLTNNAVIDAVRRNKTLVIPTLGSANEELANGSLSAIEDLQRQLTDALACNAALVEKQDNWEESVRALESMRDDALHQRNLAEETVRRLTAELESTNELLVLYERASLIPRPATPAPAFTLNITVADGGLLVVKPDGAEIQGVRR